MRAMVERDAPQFAHGWDTVITKGFNRVVPVKFWHQATIDWENSSGFINFPGDIYKETGIYVNHEDLTKVVSPSSSARERDAADGATNGVPRPDDPQAPTKKPAMRTPRAKYDWGGAYAQMSRYVHENGVPEVNADLIRYLQEWFGNECPGESVLKERVSKFLLEHRKCL
jgi:hypothetical protein